MRINQGIQGTNNDYHSMFWTRTGGGLPYETDGDARRLAYGCKFWILVSLRVFRAKRQYFKPPRSRLGFREETQNYAKRNRSQIVFLTCF